MSDITDPFNNLNLDEEELEIESALERGEFEQVPDFANRNQEIELSARLNRQLRTSKPVTLRINQLDLIKIKAKAKRSNIPYQTLLGAVLHDFAEDKKEIKLR